MYMCTGSVHPGPDKEVPVHQKSEKGAYNVKLHVCGCSNVFNQIAGVPAKTSSSPKVTGMSIMRMSILGS